MAVSNEKLANAILNAGKAYSERIFDQAKATETFESLIARFPESDLVPETLYNLYRVNKDENSPKSEAYRQRLLQNYPESEYARILSDPEYYEKKMADQKKAEKLYEEAYNKYNDQDYNGSVTLCDAGLKSFPQEILAPKFMLLRAYSVARISDERRFKEELNNLIKTWPETNESRKAEEIIAYLNQKIPELKVEEDKEIAAELYIADTTQTHSFVVIISNPAFNINQATFDVISYNIDNYTNKNYRTEGSLIDNKYLMISVSGFSDFHQALDYYNNFSTEKLIRNPSGSNMLKFIINSENLKVLNKDKNPERYQLFFLEKYPKKE